MHSALFILLAVAALVLVIGSVITVVGLRHAPEGYEDEHGFQFGRMPGETAGAEVSLFTPRTAPIGTAGETAEPAHPGLGLAA